MMTARVGSHGSFANAAGSARRGRCLIPRRSTHLLLWAKGVHADAPLEAMFLIPPDRTNRRFHPGCVRISPFPRLSTIGRTACLGITAVVGIAGAVRVLPTTGTKEAEARDGRPTTSRAAGGNEPGKVGG
jgi:hypothetical protein